METLPLAAALVGLTGAPPSKPSFHHPQGANKAGARTCLYWLNGLHEAGLLPVMPHASRSLRRCACYHCCRTGAGHQPSWAREAKRECVVIFSGWLLPFRPACQAILLPCPGHQPWPRLAHWSQPCLSYSETATFPISTGRHGRTQRCRVEAVEQASPEGEAHLGFEVARGRQLERSE